MIPDSKDYSNDKLTNGASTNGISKTKNLEMNLNKVNKMMNGNLNDKENEKNNNSILNLDQNKSMDIKNDRSTETKDANPNAKKTPMVYKLVLTGGPCSGKTTGQARLSTFFENLGWKVFRVPETASVLFSGGIRFSEMTREEADNFQENLLKTMISIENVFFDLAKTCKKNCLVICDRGTMDAAAYMEKNAFNNILKRNRLDNVELRDNRYNQVIHLITAAKGAEQFYQLEDNPCRTESIEEARKVDSLTIESWVGHPYIDVIDNSMNFDMKMRTMIEHVCRRIGIDTKDRLAVGATKHKFKIRRLPEISLFPKFQDFEVVHHYLISPNPKIQYRLRKRGQNGKFSYQHTVRRCESNDQVVEVRRQITHRDYLNYLTQQDDSHYPIFKTRRCFLYNDKYFQMDIYKSPFHPRCDGLILLETYSTKSDKELMHKGIPPFLEVEKETTGDPQYSMFNLSLKAEWNNVNFEKKKIKCVKNYYVEKHNENGQELNNNEFSTFNQNN